MSPWSDRFAAFARRRSLGPATVCAGLLACAAAIAPIEIPGELGGRTQLELSGITWSHALGKYVVVSDDVPVQGEKHAPLLFTVSADGHMEAAPIVVDVTGDLNDLESIAEAPDGTVFVVTSHSINKHGHLPKSRRRLLHLELGPDRRAKKLGEVDLTTAQTADGKPAWGSGSLDVEGLAVQGGALYVGLKAPLAADGAATILRLSNPAAVVDSGGIPAASVTVWARPRFSVRHGGAKVGEGISDLTFLPDGSLYVLANSPKGMPSDGGGSLWRLARPDASPELLERFDGLKPEGIALAPDGASVMIVFDRDGRKPVWLKRTLRP